MHDLVKTMSEADQAYETVVESGGSVQQAAVAYLATSMAGRSGDEERVEAARYVTLYQCYLVNPRMALEHDEFKRMWQDYIARGWNYSAVECFAIWGENSHTEQGVER